MFRSLIVTPMAMEPIDGTTKTNTFIGTEISDTFYGYKGTDFMYGGDGSDRLYGFSGKDQLTGGNGQDFLYGGNGADLFIYNTAGEAGQGKSADVIGDFKTGVDHLVMSAFMHGASFIGAAAFSAGGSAEVSYDRASGVLSADTDGNGTADFQITFANHTALAATDFIF